MDNTINQLSVCEAKYKAKQSETKHEAKQSEIMNCSKLSLYFVILSRASISVEYLIFNVSNNELL